MNKENFIIKSINFHGNKYDYSLVEYVNNNTKVKIICPIHGIFEQIPSSHFKHGCKKCADSYIDTIDTTKYKNYKLIIRRMLKKHKKYLFEKWDGYDYYDGEYIKDNFKLSHIDKKYPTIDHKISVYYGFKNKISPQIIGDIENLCITKRTINSQKGVKNKI